MAFSAIELAAGPTHGDRPDCLVSGGDPESATATTRTTRDEQA
jgi:hypothetical protein